MKKLFFMGFALLLCAMWPADAAAQLKIGGRKLNTGKLLEAGKDVAKAVTLSDKDIADLSREAVEWMDANNPIADETTEYGARLKRLTEGITEPLPPNSFPFRDNAPLPRRPKSISDIKSSFCYYLLVFNPLRLLRL